MSRELGDVAVAFAESDRLNAHLEMLRRVTRDMAVTPELPVLLNSIAASIAEHTGAVMVRVFLYQTEEECEVCRARGAASNGEGLGTRHLHLRADAASIGDIFGVDHLLPIDTPAPPSMVARTRQPFLTNDLLRDGPGVAHVPPALLARYRENGITAAGARPVEFRGELMGVIGMLSQRPFDPDEFELLGIFADQAGMAIKSAHLFTQLEQYRERLEVENAYLQQEIKSERGFEEIVGRSPELRSVLRKVKQVAEVETTVLLTGETGTGKELIARAIHSLSPRKDRAMIKINCGAIPHGVVESELFGHERGAFTGALQRRIGRFELADKGTLFMDEAGELPLDTQVKLLRVLQEQEFERLGGVRPIKVDVRMVAATNRDLDVAVAEGRFRADLYYRLNVFPIRVPPLRERVEDIPLLVRFFLDHFQRKLAKPLRGVTPASMRRLMEYSWPGNIRELQNVMERAAVLASGTIVDVSAAFGVTDRPAPGAIPVVDDRIVTLDEHERQQIRRALAEADGKIHGRGGAAEMLGINASTLRSRMEKHGIAKQGA
jgi:transcriptional regulator with GAF, ATPase, and Fis domain